MLTLLRTTGLTDFLWFSADSFHREDTHQSCSQIMVSASCCQQGAENGLEWKFTIADVPWQNGCSEALLKSVKKAIKGTVRNQLLSFSELQTVLFESTNLVNE